jgi:hypothetical protein
MAPVEVCGVLPSGKRNHLIEGDQMRNTGIGGSLFLVALGAILYWAVSVEAEGFNINTIGLILMVVGVVGVVLSQAGDNASDLLGGRSVCIGGLVGFQWIPKRP